MPARTPAPLTVTATYRVPKAAEGRFRTLLKRHWPILRKLKLAGAAKPVILRADEKGGPVYVEIFDWASPAAADLAHRTPAVAALWEAMGSLCKRRGPRAAMEFPHFTRIR